jgi:hypothetical protein
MMQIKLSESTTARRRIPFFCFDDDAADAYAPKTGLTFSAGEIQLSKNGAIETSSTGTVSEIGGGWYYYESALAELDTVGFLTVRPAKTDVYSNGTVVQIISVDLYDAADLGLSNLDATVSSRFAAASYQDIDDMLDAADSIETGVTLRGTFRLLLAALAGKISGGGTTTITIRNAVADSKPRITATVDSSGNRTAITTDQT